MRGMVSVQLIQCCGCGDGRKRKSSEVGVLCDEPVEGPVYLVKAPAWLRYICDIYKLWARENRSRLVPDSIGMTRMSRETGSSTGLLQRRPRISSSTIRLYCVRIQAIRSSKSDTWPWDRRRRCGGCLLHSPFEEI